MSASPHKAHPDYTQGYFDRLDGKPLASSASEPYRHGWEASDRAATLLQGHGFRTTDNRTFSKTLTIPGRGRS